MPPKDKSVPMRSCFTRLRVRAQLRSRNGCQSTHVTPYASAYEAGVDMFTRAHAGTLALQLGRELFIRLGDENYTGGMYAFQGDVIDIQNELVQVTVTVELFYVDGRNAEYVMQANIGSTDYSMLKVANTLLKCLRICTDTMTNGEYVHMPDDTPIESAIDPRNVEDLEESE